MKLNAPIWALAYSMLEWGFTITFLITGDWRWFAVTALLLLDFWCNYNFNPEWTKYRSAKK